MHAGRDVMLDSKTGNNDERRPPLLVLRPQADPANVAHGDSVIPPEKTSNFKMYLL